MPCYGLTSIPSPSIDMVTQADSDIQVLNAVDMLKVLGKEQTQWRFTDNQTVKDSNEE